MRTLKAKQNNKMRIKQNVCRLTKLEQFTTQRPTGREHLEDLLQVGKGSWKDSLRCMKVGK